MPLAAFHRACWTQVDAAEAELRLERARHSDLEVRADAAQKDLSETKQQTAELHGLNEALSRELEGVQAELAISQRAHADAADRCAAVRPHSPPPRPSPTMAALQNSRARAQPLAWTVG